MNKNDSIKLNNGISRQNNLFQLGTSFLFIGLFFLTFLPIFVKAFFIFINPNVYRLFGGIFIIIAGILYIHTPESYKKQLTVFGINFILFSVFQLIAFHSLAKDGLFAQYSCFFIGIILLLTPLKGLKKKSS